MTFSGTGWRRDPPPVCIRLVPTFEHLQVPNLNVSCGLIDELLSNEVHLHYIDRYTYMCCLIYDTHPPPSALLSWLNSFESRSLVATGPRTNYARTNHHCPSE